MSKKATHPSYDSSLFYLVERLTNSYEVMVCKAIADLKQRNGASRQGTFDRSTVLSLHPSLVKRFSTPAAL